MKATPTETVASEASEGPGLVHRLQRLLPWELQGNKSLPLKAIYLCGVVELLQGVTGAFPTAAVHHEGIPPHYCKNTGDTNKT